MQKRWGYTLYVSWFKNNDGQEADKNGTHADGMKSKVELFRTEKVHDIEYAYDA